MDLKRKIHIGITAGAGLASLLCVLGSRLFWNDIREANASVMWPATDGQVLRSRTLEGGCDDPEDYRPDILYSYRVNGSEFRSTRLHINRMFCGRIGEVRAFLGKYRVGTRVVVRYDPGRPERAVFFPEKASWIMYACLVTVLSAGVAFGLAALSGLARFLVRPGPAGRAN